MKLLVVGYYGHRNFGDDLLMKIVLDAVKGCENLTELAVSCDLRGSDYISKWYPDVKLIGPVLSKDGVYGEYDLVIFGGGGTVFDYRKSVSLLNAVRRQLRDWLLFGRAKQRGTQFVTLGLGVGPFGCDRAQKVSMNRLRYQDKVYVRDDESLQYLQPMIGDRAVMSHDLSLVEYDALAAIAQERQASEGVVILLRHYKYDGNANQYVDACIDVAKKFVQEGKKVTWAFYQNGYDDPVIERVKALGHDMWIWDPDTMSIEDAYRSISNAELLVTARMHGIYIAGMLGVPVVGIELHPKLRLAAGFFDNRAEVVPINPTSTEILEASTRVLAAEVVKEQPVARYASEVQGMFAALAEWVEKS